MFLRALPQAQGLGWDQYFPDKEFLYHQFTTLAYRFGGDRGVVAVSFAMALASILAFLWFAAGRISLRATFAITGLVFFCPYLVFRLMLVRPHTLGVFCFCLLNFAILRRSPRFTGFAAFLFVLGYHAFYLPIIFLTGLMGLTFLVDPPERGNWRRVGLFGLFGCLCGILINPYFPSNIEMGVIHALVPELMNESLKYVSFGDELYPLTTEVFVKVFGFSILAVAAGLVNLRRNASHEFREEAGRDIAFLYQLGVCVLLLLLSTQTKRVGEYLVPASGILLVLLVEQWKRWKTIGECILVGACLIQSIYLYQFYLHEKVAHSRTRVLDTFAAISKIPGEAAGKIVLNCEWDRSPYLLYARPDLRFIDILDPSLLYFGNPGAFRAKEELKQGRIGDARTMLHDVFKADYVFCGRSELTNQLKDDPDVDQIFPTPGSVEERSPYVQFVFRVRDKPSQEYVKHFNVELLNYSGSEDHAAIPSSAKGHGGTVDMMQSTYLNLSLLPQADSKRNCALISPDETEMRRLAGASLVGLGGGPILKLWVNGKPSFRTRLGFFKARSVQIVVPLDVPLKPSDRIELLVCPKDTLFWGGALSLWRPREVESVCARKSPAAVKEEIWPMQGTLSQTCIGPMAVRDAAPSLRTSGQ